MTSLPAATWVRLIVRLVIGFVIYSGFGRRHSRLQLKTATTHADPVFKDYVGISSSLRAWRMVCALGAIAAITFICVHLFAASRLTVGLTLLLAILAMAMTWGLLEALVAAVAGVLCISFYMMPPIGSFRVDEPENVVALGTFLVASLATSYLSASLKKQAAAAVRSQEELQRLYALSRALVLADPQTGEPQQMVDLIARIFGVEGVALYDGSSGRIFRSVSGDTAFLDAHLRAAAERGSVFEETGAAVLPIRVEGKPVGSLGLLGTFASDYARLAIAHLAATAMVQKA